MRNVALSEAKDNLSKFVAAAARGEEIVITRHGKPAAKLVAASEEPKQQRRARAALDNLARLREEMRREGRTATIEEMIAWKNEGRP